jgi:manganese-dependent inorganic pyrophosphatase
MDNIRTFVTGHRNPDIDSIAAAIVLAELRRRQGGGDVVAVCPGELPERAKYLLDRFGLPAPQIRTDVYVRVRDIMEDSPIQLSSDITLWEGFEALRQSGLSRIPVTAPDGSYLGMLSPMGLLKHLLALDKQDAEGGFTGREITSSIKLIAQVLNGECLTEFDSDRIQSFVVYVAAMQAASFEEHLPADRNSDLAIIVGDRPEIHLKALHRGVRLLLVTGAQPVDALIIEEAARRNVTIMKCPCDSASIIRRLPFAVPLNRTRLRGQSFILSPNDKLRDVGKQISRHYEDDIPVIDGNNRLAGVVYKKDAANQPFQMILVDHNELEQSLPGVESVPIIEVVDHHRLRTIPTDQPIRFTTDVVGSTCTLVSAMFRNAGESITTALAGMLLAGIITDTLNLKSPTTSERDKRAAAWLEKIAGVTGTDLMQELASIASPLASRPPLEVLNADRKNYAESGISFALSQVEESNLALLSERHDELLAAMREIMASEQLAFIALLVTDPVRENSLLLMLGGEKMSAALPYRQQSDGIFELPGVLSRKKQLLPQILTAIRESQN